MRFLPVLCSWMLFAWSCAPAPKEAHLMQYRFVGLDPLQGNIVFTFDQEIGGKPAKSVNAAVSYLHFDPSVPGQFRWLSPSELGFSSQEALCPGQAYTVNVDPKVFWDKYEIRVATETALEIPAGGLNVLTYSPYWAANPKRGEEQYLHYGLILNYVTPPALFRDKVQVSINGAAHAFELRSQQASDTLMIGIPGIPESNQKYRVDFQLDPGLRLPREAYRGEKALREDCTP